jgi:putative restriction endonuclease
MMEQKFWILKSKGEKSAFGGNLGYADQPASHYVYDTNVKNHNKLKAGDLVVIADKHFIIGYARITDIDSVPDVPKVRYRCPFPDCKTQELYARKGISPKYRCRNKHEFDTPDSENILVEEFTARYSTTFFRPEEKTSVSILDNYYLKRNYYYSIQEADIRFFERELPALTPGFSAQAIQQLRPPAAVKDIPPYLPTFDDERDYATLLKAIRKGQSRFKTKLIEIYDHYCMITGCTVPAAIEASHICPYKGKNDNSPLNGLLLRTDLHKLFDNNLIGIDPGSLKIVLHPSLAGTYYEKYNGKKLKYRRKDFFPSQDALTYRWKIFQRAVSGKAVEIPDTGVIQ